VEVNILSLFDSVTSGIQLKGFEHLQAKANVPRHFQFGFEVLTVVRMTDQPKLK
jgi:hypothetical protein